MSKYQNIGIEFASATEAGEFLRSQGFDTASEGYLKECPLTGEIIEASFTLTNSKCYISMKPRFRLEGRGDFVCMYRGCAVYDRNETYTAFKPSGLSWNQIAHKFTFAALKDEVDRYLDR